MKNKFYKFSIENIKWGIIFQSILITQIVDANTQDSTWVFIGGPCGTANHIFKSKSGRVISDVKYNGIYYSDDTCGTWIESETINSISPVRSFAQHPDGEIYALCEDGYIISSIDDGITWEKIYNYYYKNNHAGIVIDENNGYIYYFVHKYYASISTDKGLTWNEIWSGNITDINVNSSGSIYISTDDGCIYKSLNYGQTWEEIEIPFKDEYRFYISEIYISPDDMMFIKVFIPGGLYWFDEYSQNYKLINSEWYDYFLGFTPDHELFTSYGDGIAIFHNSDKSWELLSHTTFVKSQMAIEGFWFNDSTCIVNYSSMGLFKTSDRGKHWYRSDNGMGYSTCLSIIKSENNRLLAGIASYAFWGGLFYSDDSGNNWSNIYLNAIYPPLVRDIRKINNYIFAATSYGEFRSKNNGQTWEIIFDDLILSHFISSAGIVYIGLNGDGIYVSSNFGNSWKKSCSGLNHWYFKCFGEDCNGKVFASATPYPALYYTDNSGISWTQIKSGPLYNVDVNNFTLYEDTLYAATSSGIARLDDENNYWEYWLKNIGSVNDVEFLSSSEIIVSKGENGIYLSCDKGKCWNRIDIDSGLKYVYDIYTSDSNYIYIGTNRGIYFCDKYLTVEPEDNEFKNGYPDNYLIESIYPNPFNTHCVIKFVTKQKYDIKIFNILGECINSYTIDNRNYFIWDGIDSKNRPVSSNIYFICAKNQKQEFDFKKVIYLK